MNCVRILLYFSLSCSQAVWRLHSEPNYTLSMSRVGELCAVCRDSDAMLHHHAVLHKTQNTTDFLIIWRSLSRNKFNYK